MTYKLPPDFGKQVADRWSEITEENAWRDHLKALEKRQASINRIHQVMETNIDAYYEHGLDKKLQKLWEK
jgi:hypothetical protein